MELLRWMGWMYARFVAVSVALLGGVLFFNNLSNPGDESVGVWIWILASGLLGVGGGVAFLLSIDGPRIFRRRWVRTAAWAAMLAAVLLPTSLTLMLAPLTLLLLPSVIWFDKEQESEDVPVTSG